MSLKVLSVASECDPFVKTGGLADVVGALAKALVAEDVESRVLLPMYRKLTGLKEKATEVAVIPNLHGGSGRVWAVNDSGIDLLLLEAPHLYDRSGHIYMDDSGNDWGDNFARFGALARVGAEIGLGAIDGWVPDVVHCHDWQAGLTPAYMKQSGRAHPRTVMTIQNIAFQGLFGYDTLHPLGLDTGWYHPEAFEYYSNVSFLKAGLTQADAITTVSPTYARELMEPEFGMGLQGVIASRQADLSGILNGIDLEQWDPTADPHLAAPYSSKDLSGKAVNKTVVQERFGLDVKPDAPLFVVISRLTQQKGLDLVPNLAPHIAERGGQLALVGTGEPGLEYAYRKLAEDFAGTVGTFIGFDEGLAHLVQAGADAILVPSRFEPCGLTQLCALRYGTLPIVAHTGGLADTVIDANPAALAAGCATGFQFSPTTGHAFAGALDRCFDLYKNKKAWTKAVRRAMGHPVGWETSAKEIAGLYRRLAG